MNIVTKEEHLSTADLAGMARGDQAANPEAANRAHPLFPAGDANDLRAQWDRIQTGFVDEPRQSVQKADELVAHTIKHLAEKFAQERSRLEQQWDRGDQVNTEDLRLALQTYRSFFQRLLAI